MVFFSGENPKEVLIIQYFYITSIKETSVKVGIVNLSDSFNTSNYKSAGVTEYKYTGTGSGAASSIGGIVYDYKASRSGSSTELQFTVSGLSPNTKYTWYAYARAANGKYYAITNGDGSYGETFRTDGNSRPEKFSWTTSKGSGRDFIVSASEWNRLIENVKDLHAYKMGEYDSSYYPLKTVRSGYDFEATYFNQVRYAIGSLKATGISTKRSDDPIYASDLNSLVSTLNSIK